MIPPGTLCKVIKARSFSSEKRAWGGGYYLIEKGQILLYLGEIVTKTDAMWYFLHDGNIVYEGVYHFSNWVESRRWSFDSIDVYEP